MRMVQVIPHPVIPRRIELLDAACLGKIEPWQARKQLRVAAVAQVDEQRCFPGTIGQECLVHLRSIESAHRSAVETERARCKDEVARLERGALQRQSLAFLRRK